MAKEVCPNIVGCKFTDSEMGDLGLCTQAGYNCLLGADD